MGALSFSEYVYDVADVDTAFRQAVADARDEHGDGGYTGTIAEKTSWVLITEDEMSPVHAVGLAEDLIEDEDERITAADGPAGVIPIFSQGISGWLFFGWARW